MNDQITRRSALMASLTTLLAASAASVLPTAAQAAPEAVRVQPDPLTTLAQTDADFSAWFARWRAKHDEASAQYDALTKELNPHIDDATAKLVSEREDVRLTWNALEWQLYFEATVRHFPGIGPALRAVFEHQWESYQADNEGCCSEGIEPW